MTDELTFSDTFRYLDPAGFEHMVCVKAVTWEGLQILLQEARTDLVSNNNKPLISSNLRITNEPLPSAESAPRTVPARDGGDVIALPPDVHLFTVKELFHDTNQDGTYHMLKVVIEEQDYQYANGNYGISCFHPESAYPNWQKWQVEQRKSPSENADMVLVRDPQGKSKRAEVIEFRSSLET